MTRPLTREEMARLVARRLARRVARVAPPGLGRWQRAWELVGPPSERFVDLLVEWEHADPADGQDEVRKQMIRAAADDVVQAWAAAARLWEDAGRPETWAAREGASTVAA